MLKVIKTHDAYPLRTVAAMTGLTPALIRAWERYQVVAPIRGARGARLYTAGDVAHLRLLARAVGGGRAIGDVAALRPAELEKLVAQRSPAGPGERHEIGLLLAMLLALDVGVNVVYLGIDLPAGEIVAAARHTQARVVGLSVEPRHPQCSGSASSPW